MSFIWSLLIVVLIILAGVLSSLSVWYNGKLSYKNSYWTALFAAVSAFAALLVYGGSKLFGKKKQDDKVQALGSQ